MTRSSVSRVFVLGALFAGACASSNEGSGTGGSHNSGGASSQGGSNASGGSGSGGGIGSGGSNAGGTSARGGATGLGGAATGGSNAGGTPAAGGSSANGGAASGGRTGTGGSASGGNTGGTATGGTATGGTAAGGAATGGTTGTGGSTSSLPPLTVSGTKLQDPTGKTIILRGSSLIDIGALYTYFGGASGITGRMDKIAAAGVQGHVVRFPVYPKIDYNAGYPTCSPMPYPVGGTGSAGCTPKSPINAADYVSKVLKPAVDYATSKDLYVIIDFHQIDDMTTSNNSTADAATFWADVAPKFAGYSNVLYEVFNEPIDGLKSWADIKPKVQTLVDTVRTAGANNVIIVPSNSYCQRPGDAASDPPTDPKKNLMYTAHIYPGNWNANFKAQVATAITKAPVFISEWGYILNNSDATLGTSNANWGTDLQTLVNSNGASWTAWVTDNQWTPYMFSDSNMTTLTDFGTLAKTWLASKATSDWVK